eukprot:TRINITY_DN26884_c0_g1_i3.p1 TRINITY_DN26884_c0_g1~~TRINITY_DN26884_c0_g1_i3.p1  ORF type:complete len:337 (+),score=43.08 TRINITY_DN26884_c0_g1_i3:173-1183(+)
MPHNNNFDALRLLLASIVVFFHASILSQAPQLAFLQRYFSATFAVQAFFAVSGFLIFMSFERSPRLADYAEKRARRIFPAYICVIALSVVLGGVLTTLAPADYWGADALYRYIGFNLAFLNYKAAALPGVFEGQYQDAVNGSLWTLKIELMFYAFVPFLYWLCQRFAVYRVLGLLFLSSVAWYCGLISQSDGSGLDIYAKLAKQFPGQLSFFVAGVALYQWKKEGRSIHWSVFVVAMILYCVLEGLSLMLVSAGLVAIIAIYIAVYAPYLGKVGRYGDFSYGVYIFHFPIVQTFVMLGLFNKNPWLALAGVIATVAEIGRAVQQECRDRSRMPSSA